MTTKTHYAMFAIAAIAAVSFGFIPAFASVYTYVDVNAPASGSAYESDYVDCGSGECFGAVRASASQDYVRFHYGISEGAIYCDVTSELSIEGQATRYYDWGTIAGGHSEYISTSIDTNDTVVAANFYSNCS